MKTWTFNSMLIFVCFVVVPESVGLEDVDEAQVDEEALTLVVPGWNAAGSKSSKFEKDFIFIYQRNKKNNNN